MPTALMTGVDLIIPFRVLSKGNSTVVVWALRVKLRLQSGLPCWRLENPTREQKFAQSNRKFTSEPVLLRSLGSNDSKPVL